MTCARAFLTAVLIAAGATGASGHQVDECVQAARIGVFHDRVVVDVDLSPGMTVAPFVWKAIDRDGDGRIAPREIQEYADGIVRRLSLSIDGHRRAVSLVRADSPGRDELQDGEGTIRFEAVSEFPSLSRGRHRIRFENGNEPAGAVYLVNALAPSSAAISVVAQRRDPRQRSVSIDVDVEGRLADAWWLALISAGVLCAFTLWAVRPVSVDGRQLRTPRRRPGLYNGAPTVKAKIAKAANGVARCSSRARRSFVLPGLKYRHRRACFSGGIR